MYIYADVVFIINLVMNSTILLLTAWTADINYKTWRILVAAVIGSCYVLLEILPGMMIFQHILCKVALSFLLILIAFGLRSRRIMFLLVAFFYVISFMLGGAVVGWLYFGQTNGYLGNSPIIMADISWRHLLWGSIMGTFLIMIVLRRMLVCVTRHSHLYEVILEYEGRRIELNAMLDTGNGLYTTIGRKPVILVNQHAVTLILNHQVRSFLKNNTPDMWLTNLNQCTDLGWLSRVEIIPYHSIGHKDLLLAFRLDHFVIMSKEGNAHIDNVMIGIYSGTLSKDGAYDVLLHPHIMNKLSKKEEASICA